MKNLIFQFDDYRKALRSTLLSRKAVVPADFSFQRLAAFCRVQKTYISSVLSCRSHLSRDQLFAACDFLGVDSAEMSYLELLYEYQRSDNRKRKSRLREQIESKQREFRKTENYIALKSEAPFAKPQDDSGQYYLSPIVQVVHIFLTVDRYAKSPISIAKALNVDETTLSQALSILLRLNLIKSEGSGVVVTNDSMHLSADSWIYQAHRSLLRHYISHTLSQRGSDVGYNFSVTFSSCPEVKKWLQSEVLRLIGVLQKKVATNPVEDIYQFSVDLFSWSQDHKDLASGSR